jgi:cardiolipin synthase
MASQSEILTIPNGITAIRALGIPLFLWAYLSLDNLSLAFIILTIGALSDYFDGKVARALNQESKLGAALDPTIDRAYIAATALALVIKDIVPFWLLLLLIARDLWVAVALLIKTRKGNGVFEVTFLGKAATFNLLYAFPFLLLSGESGVGAVFYICGWAFAIWGCALYLVTGLQYTAIAFTRSKK